MARQPVDLGTRLVRRRRCSMHHIQVNVVVLGAFEETVAVANAFNALTLVFPIN